MFFSTSLLFSDTCQVLNKKWLNKSSALKLNCRWFEDFQQDSRFIFVVIILYQVLYDFFGGYIFYRRCTRLNSLIQMFERNKSMACLHWQIKTAFEMNTQLRDRGVQHLAIICTLLVCRSDLTRPRCIGICIWPPTYDWNLTSLLIQSYLTSAHCVSATGFYLSTVPPAWW